MTSPLLDALSENVGRKMDKFDAEGKIGVNAYIALEIARKERAEGPVVLSPEQRRLATAPEPSQPPSQPSPQHGKPVRQEPRLTRER